METTRAYKHSPVSPCLCGLRWKDVDFKWRAIWVKDKVAEEDRRIPLTPYLAGLLRARKDAGLTQAEVAERMGVSQPVLARIESSLGSRKHSPSLATLRKYADACGKKLVIQMV